MQIASPDSEAIRQAAEDYFGGWYRADVGRIDRALHAGLAKRAVRKDEHGSDYLRQLTKDVMLQATRDGGGTDVPVRKRRWEVTILDQYAEIAVVKVVSAEYVEYLHLAKLDGRWLIVNTLYTTLPLEDPG